MKVVKMEFHKLKNEILNIFCIGHCGTRNHVNHPCLLKSYIDIMQMIHIKGTTIGVLHNSTLD